MGSKKVEIENPAEANEKEDIGMVELKSEPVDDRTESPRSNLKPTNNFPQTKAWPRKMGMKVKVSTLHGRLNVNIEIR